MKVFYERDEVITKKIFNYLTAQFAFKVIPFRLGMLLIAEI